MEFEIKKNDKVKFIEESDFPKYTTQIMNVFNGGAGSCTGPKVVGPLKDIFQKFLDSGQEPNLENWKKFYEKDHIDKYDIAFQKIKESQSKYINAIKLINDEMLKEYQKDLIIKKTFLGLSVEYFILNYLSEKYELEYRFATSKEESQNIDGYIDGNPIQIKPESHKSNIQVKNININVPIIYYVIEKNKKNIRVITPESLDIILNKK